jgi:hypothetical protein
LSELVGGYRETWTRVIVDYNIDDFVLVLVLVLVGQRSGIG